MKIRLSDHFSYQRLLRYVLPSILMMVFISIYGVVDGYFISNYVGKTPFAAVNFIMPFLMLFGALGFMVGSGGSALIGKYLGEGRANDSKQLFSMLVWLTAAVSVGIAFFGELILEHVARALGANDTMLPYCVRYGWIMLLGVPLLVLQFEFYAFFPVAEKPHLGLYITVAAGFINMVLDWLLVGILCLDVEGAAVATVASQAVGGLVPVVYFLFPNRSLLRLGKPHFDGGALLKVIGNGFSEFVSNISMSIVSMLYNSQLMKYTGENGVAAYGVLMYVCFVFIAIFVGFSVGTAPIISYHFGARNLKELRNVFHKSLWILATFAVIMLVAGELLAKPLSTLYVGKDPALMNMTLHAFRIFSFSFLFCAAPIFGSSFFTALNDGKTSATISFLRTLALQTITVLLLPLIFGLDGIWFSLVVAEIIATFVTVAFWVVMQPKYHY